MIEDIMNNIYVQLSAIAVLSCFGLSISEYLERNDNKPPKYYYYRIAFTNSKGDGSWLFRTESPEFGMNEMREHLIKLMSYTNCRNVVITNVSPAMPPLNGEKK